MMLISESLAFRHFGSASGKFRFANTWHDVHADRVLKHYVRYYHGRPQVAFPCSHRSARWLAPVRRVQLHIALFDGDTAIIAERVLDEDGSCADLAALPSS
jgi:hypothetical protein